MHHDCCPAFVYFLAFLKFSVAPFDMFTFLTQYLLERMIMNTRIISQPHATDVEI